MTTPYQPLKPMIQDQLDQSYADIQANFQQMNTTFSADHVPITQINQNGYHKTIHQVPFSTTASNPPNNFPIVAPVAVVGFSQLFTAQCNDGYGTDILLGYVSGTNPGLKYVLNRNFAPVAPNSSVLSGCSFLPGGVVIQWGFVENATTDTTINFTKTFSSNLYSIVLQPAVNSNGRFSYNVKTSSLSGFTASIRDSAGAPTTFSIYWIALGF